MNCKAALKSNIQFYWEVNFNLSELIPTFIVHSPNFVQFPYCAVPPKELHTLSFVNKINPLLFVLRAMGDVTMGHQLQNDDNLFMRLRLGQSKLVTLTCLFVQYPLSFPVLIQLKGLGIGELFYQKH